jgi:MSHA biogenesis protein MshG
MCAVPRFEYSGRSRSGALVSGALEAGSLDAAVGQLAAQEITPLQVNERAPAPPGLRRRLGLEQPSGDDVILFTRQMYALTRAGVPLIRGLTQLAASTRNAVLADAIGTVNDDLESGRSFSAALARHPRIFSTLYVSIVRVGEESGRLDQAFMQIHRFLENEKEVVQRIKSATRYPMIVIVVMLIAIMLLMGYVIPVFAGVFERFGTELPMPTRILIAASNFVAAWWWAIIGAAVGGWLWFRLWRKTPAGELAWDRRKLALPVVGDILLRGALSRFARAFAMSQRSGVPILEAMNVVSTAVGNAWIGRKVVQMREGVERGDSLSRTAARAEVFTPLVLQMLAVGEETGQLDAMIEEVADFYEREVDYDVRNLSSLIEPILTLGIGFLVFLLALGVFLPMWELGSAMLK